MNTTFIQEKKKPYSRNLTFEKRLICRIENGIDNQEVHPRNITPSTFKGDYHDTEIIDSKPISNGELTSEPYN